MIERYLKCSIYILLIISTILIIFFVLLKVFKDCSNLEHFKKIDMDKQDSSGVGWNRGCVGSIYVPHVRKCPQMLPYEWGPNNNSPHGICCNKYPKPDSNILNTSIYECVQGVLRSNCTGCKNNEYDTGEIPNDHSGICCAKKKE